MDHINFAGATDILGPPKNWNSAAECQPLIVRNLDGIFTSVWKPTTGEIEMLRAGAFICLHVWGGQPPVQILTEFVEEITLEETDDQD